MQYGTANLGIRRGYDETKNTPPTIDWLNTPYSPSPREARLLVACEAA